MEPCRRPFGILSLVGVAACGAEPASPPPLVDLAPLHESVRLRIHDRPDGVATHDFNGDGRDDLVIGGDSISILVADGVGGWDRRSVQPMESMEQAIDFAMGDVNGDGRIDLVVAEHNAPQAQFLLWLGATNGSFQRAPGSPFRVDAEPHLHTLALFDVNRDGHLDVITDSWPENRLVVVLGNGDGTFDLPGRPIPVPSAPMQNLVAADFNEDGWLDVVTPAHDREAITVMLGDAQAHLRAAPGSPFAAFGGFTTVACVDVDADGHQDVLAVHRSDASTQYKVDGLSVMLGDGTGNLQHAPGSPFQNLPERSNALAHGDWNGDGFVDLAVLGEVHHELALWLGSPEGLQRAGRFRVDGRSRGLGAADVDGDGRDELLVPDFAAAELIVLAWSATDSPENSGE